MCFIRKIDDFYNSDVTGTCLCYDQKVILGDNIFNNDVSAAIIPDRIKYVGKLLVTKTTEYKHSYNKHDLNCNENSTTH